MNTSSPAGPSRTISTVADARMAMGGREGSGLGMQSPGAPTRGAAGAFCMGRAGPADASASAPCRRGTRRPCPRFAAPSYMLHRRILLSSSHHTSGHSEGPMQVEEGQPHPLGATYTGEGVNFAVFSAHATRVEVC
ncbi:MAG TPA: hypothetical protein VE084_09500, partial [Burkholderiaceae bacterium]|nr:hypothetical protein [Burkholderiaceae bacterium]